MGNCFPVLVAVPDEGGITGMRSDVRALFPIVAKIK
jgi:hypothetical protein